jgi:hypothetical protein
VSAGNPEKFPWGDNSPSRRSRLLFALLTGIISSLAVWSKLLYRPSEPVDFDLIWMGSRILWSDADPYQLIGPAGAVHWNFQLLYPAPALIAALPLALLPIHAAAIAFVFIGSALLAFGSTRDGWHRLPLFVSAAFVDTTLGAQWSSLMVAGVFLPIACVFACAKPQVGLGAVIASASRQNFLIAATGTLVLSTIAFIMLPEWFGEWLSIARKIDHMKPALFQPGGFLILFALLRWKRPETWGLLTIALLPQTLMWYSFLILLAFPRTYREACVLSLLSSSGYLIYHLALDRLPPTEATMTILWLIVIATTYMPCVAMIVRRPNVHDALVLRPGAPPLRGSSPLTAT